MVSLDLKHLVCPYYSEDFSCSFWTLPRPRAILQSLLARHSTNLDCGSCVINKSEFWIPLFESKIHDNLLIGRTMQHQYQSTVKPPSNQTPRSHLVNNHSAHSRNLPLLSLLPPNFIPRRWQFHTSLRKKSSLNESRLWDFLNNWHDCPFHTISIISKVKRGKERKEWEGLTIHNPRKNACQHYFHLLPWHCIF